MWQLSVGIELHELFKKLIVEILAIPASSGAVDYFLNVAYDAQIGKTICRQKLGNFSL